MGELRFKLTFFGGKAEGHRVPAQKLGNVLHDLEHDITNVCHLISSDDPNIDLSEILSGCKLYVVGTPKAGSLEIPIATRKSETAWPEKAGRAYLIALRNLPDSEELPKGLNRAILENVINYVPRDREYDGFRVTIDANGEPEYSVTIDSTLVLAATQKLAELTKIPISRIYSHSITGVMYSLMDQNYDDPQSSVTVEVDTGDGKRWLCRIPREKIPDRLSEHWTERVLVHGTATFRPRKPEMEVDNIQFLGPSDDLEDAIERFINSNREVWKGEDTQVFLDYVRERDQ